MKIKAYIVWLVSIVAALVGYAQADDKQTLFLSCSPQSDLYKVLERNGIPARRFQTPPQAVSAAPDGGGVLILAEGYPQRTTDIAPAVFALARRKTFACTSNTLRSYPA